MKRPVIIVILLLAGCGLAGCGAGSNPPDFQAGGAVVKCEPAPCQK